VLVSRSWSTLVLAVTFTGCLTWGVQEDDDGPGRPQRTVPAAVVPDAATAGPAGQAAPPPDDERLALSRRTAAWSQLRRALLAAPEGVSASQITQIEELLADMRAARRGGAPLSAAREQHVHEQMAASPLAARPSVAAALRNLSRQLPEPSGDPSDPHLTPAGR
jgi:hypothetical protein